MFSRPILHYECHFDLRHVFWSEQLLQSLKEEYLIGTKTISDFLEEEEKFLTLKVNYFNAKKDYLISYFKIKSLEGTLLENFKEFLPKLN